MCRIVSSTLNTLNIKTQTFFDEMAVYRYLKREYSYLPLPQRELPTGRVDTIWTFWAQGLDSMPPKIRCCYDSLLRNKGNYKVVLIDKDNVGEYLDIPERIQQLRESGKMSWTHFSDYLRVSLLAKYGGWYIDTTVYVTRTVPEMEKLFTIRLRERDYSVADGNWCGFLWYMPKGHPLGVYLLNFLNEYWRKNDSVIVYFLLDHATNVFFSRNKTCKRELKNIPYSCPNLLFFQHEASEQRFEQKAWDEMVDCNLFFKNNWRTKLTMELEDGSETFYGHVFGEYQK